MNKEQDPIQTLEEIKQMMGKGSRFAALSGWSGIVAGVAGLASAYLAHLKFHQYGISENQFAVNPALTPGEHTPLLSYDLLIIALVTFVVAFVFAYLFTYIKSRKAMVRLWGLVTRKVFINLGTPMLVGAIFIWRLVGFGLYAWVVPSCLIFYGLALINASKFTLPEVRYLGYFQVLTGVLNLWFLAWGLYFWAAGFGILHILYGIVLWNKYERREKRIAE